MSDPAAPPAGDETMELETSDAKPRRVGMIILLITFGFFGTWATFAPLDSASLAPGVVGVKGQRKTVQHLEGGIVKEILVTDGELVSEGQPVVVLDDTQYRAELGTLRGQFYSAKAGESRLLAERDGLEAIEFPTVLTSEDGRADEAKTNEIAVFNARRSSRLGQKDVLEQRIVQLQSQIKGLQEQIKSKKELQASFVAEIEDQSVLLGEGFVDKMRIVELERSETRTRGELADHAASIAQTEVAIGETQLEILQLENEFKTEVVDLLGQAQAEVFDLSERIAATEDRVRRTVVRAPNTGLVLGLSTHTIGGVISGGQPIMDIVPGDEELIVEARVPPIDIDRVQTGMVADVRFSAFKSATTHTVKGELTKISADRLVDEQTGEAYYMGKVAIDPADLARLGADLTLVPGMPAEVLITTGERTMMQYLMAPVSNAMARSMIED